MFWEVLRRRGPYLSWQWLLENPLGKEASDDERSSEHGYLGYVYTLLRDFLAAERELNTGLEKDPKSRWFKTLLADNLHQQDRFEEALDLVGEVIESHPNYVSALDLHSEVLMSLGLRERAITTLEKASESKQSRRLISSLTMLYIEAGHLDEAERTLDTYQRYSPLLEKGRDTIWLNGKRCDVASRKGNHKAAQHWAEQAGESGFYKKVGEKLAKAKGELKSRTLAVPHIQQHHLTCAPATISSLAAFWKKPVEHLELAEEICYDGTADYRERNWAEEHGWINREFRVTLESTKQLIDRGIPFVMNTVYPGGAHAQAVIGYDECRSVLFIRDPDQPSTIEFLAEEGLQEQRPFGPRGFLIVPPEKSGLLEGLSLPDEGAYDLNHQLDLALDRHQRETGQDVLVKLQSQFPDSPIRWHGELTLARYDGNLAQALHCLDQLLKTYPGVINWQVERLDLLRSERGTTAVIEALREYCSDREASPLLLRMLVREIHWDGRHDHEVRQLLRRIHRQRVDANTIHTEANMDWTRGLRTQATAKYRISSCLEDKNASLAESYFRAANWIGETEAGLEHLRSRFEMDGGRSGQPAMTLFRALEQIDQIDEGLDILEVSLARRPDDSDHAVRVANELAAWGRVERSEKLLKELPSAARAANWHRAKAQIARRRGDIPEEMAQWREVIRDHPLNIDGHRALSKLIAETEGPQAAIQYLKAKCAQFPYHWSLHQTLAGWLHDQGPGEWERGIRELLRIDPLNGWAQRELATALSAQKRFSEAHDALEIAQEQEPHALANHTVRGGVLEDNLQLADARSEFRTALAIDIDSVYAMQALIRLCQDDDERRESLRFVQKQLETSRSNGDGVLAFADLARPYFEKAELLTILRSGLEARPDRWETGVAVARQLVDMARPSEGADYMVQVTESFPLIPRVWLELGLCYAAIPDAEQEIKALEQIRRLNPSWIEGMCALADSYSKCGRYHDAKNVLHQLVQRCPSDAVALGYLADTLWHLEERKAAIEHLEIAVSRDAGYDWAWGQLQQWGRLVGRPDAAHEAAQRLIDDKPGEARTWIRLADTLTDETEVDERVVALRKALDLNPRGHRIRDELARVLSDAGRFEDAIEACRDDAESSQPTSLQVREAWVRYCQGRETLAIQLMNQALAIDSAIPWAWKLLTDWHTEGQRFSEAEKALEQLTRLEPNDPVHLGYLANLRFARGEPNAAKSALEKALLIAPNYYFAFQELYKIHLEGRMFADAADLLSQSTPHLRKLDHLARSFQIEIMSGNEVAARQALEQMLVDPDEFPPAFNRVLASLESHEQSQSLRNLTQTVEEHLNMDELNGEVGSLYVGMMKLQRRLPKLAVLETIRRPSDTAFRAFEDYAYRLGEEWQSKRKNLENLLGLPVKRQLTQLLSKHGKWLKPHEGAWGAIGYALNTMKRYKETADWLSDWSGRKQLSPYIFNNLALAYQKTGQSEKAKLVVKEAVTLGEHNPIKMRLHTWRAVDLAIEGDIDSAQHEFSSVNPEELDSFGKALFDFAESFIPYADKSSSAPSFAPATREIFARFLELNDDNPVMQGWVGVACKSASQRLGILFPTLWYYGTRYKGRVFVIYIILFWSFIRLIA